MKKTILLVLLTLAGLTVNAQIVKGDMNGDGKITMADANEVTNTYLGKQSQEELPVYTKSEVDSIISKLEARIEALEKNSGVTIDAHEYVDLGLPSKTLWATCNVGAEKPEDYGLYFAWGETEGYTGKTIGYTTDTSDGHSFNFASYKWCNGSDSRMTKYSTSTKYWDSSLGTSPDQKTVLDAEDDAATTYWGSGWCMPTKLQWDELKNNCTWEWKKVNDKNGYIVTASNGNTLFLPAAGYRYGSTIDFVGNYGYYWSSDLGTDYPYNAWLLDLNSSRVFTTTNGRYCGLSVRAVRSASKN